MKQQIVITSLALIFAGELVSSASANRREYEDRSRELDSGGRGSGGRGRGGGRDGGGGRGRGGGRGGRGGRGGGRGGMKQRLFTSFAEPLVMPSNGNADADENGSTKMMVDVSKWLLPVMPMLFVN